MRTLTPAGQQAVQEIAQRHGYSTEAVLSMLDAVIAGNGSMAQFNHPEFAGSGQWMRGGMIMVSDLFNNALKARVGALCDELSNLVANQPGLVQTGSFQSQSQSGGGYGSQSQSGGGSFQSQGSGGYGGYSSSSSGDGGGLFEPQADWWGPSLRYPNSVGGQNDTRYAYFAQARRLAVQANGHVTVYDTLDHQIGGFSQQQGGFGSFSFSSQFGQFDVSSLPIVSVDGQAPAVNAAAPMSSSPAPAGGGSTGGMVGSNDVFATIERLAELQAKGVLSADEFQQKKAELLSRL